MEYRAPQKLFDAFEGDGRAKAKARQDVINWLSEQPIQNGDVVIVPDAITGLETRFTKDQLEH